MMSIEENGFATSINIESPALAFSQIADRFSYRGRLSPPIAHIGESRLPFLQLPPQVLRREDPNTIDQVMTRHINDAIARYCCTPNKSPIQQAINDNIGAGIADRRQPRRAGFQPGLNVMYMNDGTGRRSNRRHRQ